MMRGIAPDTRLYSSGSRRENDILGPSLPLGPAQTYVTNLNNALAKFPEFKGLGLVDVNTKAGTAELPSEIATVVRNNGGGHW
jgi:hypothetical protein